mmetsp:Transcript_5741/g.9971  ORF Transcript_5741/g.9971 Transcript_5741/m.9971 type:complete len:163 (-) Transcript_5741:429-917(-)|eukprot:CAMPEP_0119108488 /NCGR_PEP_ID=MMETSP1180-20130426/14632_1 /TAXON_ID=3052 ORGANISM="Chlamydomonas cf sp, Strain CCMP681" /NCGR_SAMPLE_ID=MMETSP1180 /ASSEMBLY_ACC=CAM_ASM_000741 /LENGTH=162 /DNA_ID=CAMNT_0007094105 /DNA_START=60 /DNA_END=548 /DNA_ORIENTATION=-
MNAALARLAEERKNWRKDKPFQFVAKPSTARDGSVNLMKWDCSIPGPDGTEWEGGQYPLTLLFGPSYPEAPPTALFPPGFFHMNVYPEGEVCLSILNDDTDMCGQWSPSISVKQILLGIQTLLTDPNQSSPAQSEAHRMYLTQRVQYIKRIKEQAQKYRPKD